MPGSVFLIAALALSADWLTKVVALKYLSLGQSLKVLPGIFHLTLVYNTGAAFGLLKNHGFFFTCLALFVIAFIIFYALRLKTKRTFLCLALGLILGGACGNLLDRIFRGYVVDFIDLRIWPVFNVADSCITAGIVLLAAKLFFAGRK